MAETPNTERHERDNATVSVEVADKDRFAVVVDRIRVQRQDGGAAAPAARDVAAGIDYLGERLKVVESGPDEALVRTAVPATAKDGKQYYEFRFESDEVVMERRHAKGSGDVAAVPFVVPNQTLDRLVDDLGRMIGGEPADPAS